METYNGLVRTPTDAIILFEACRLGLLPRVQRRLSEKERQSIRSGSVFVWDEREAGMRRWTDGKSWSASRVSGSFLTYREMEGKRGSTSFNSPANRTTATPETTSADEPADGEEGPDGYRYKPDGLMKQSFSITTSQGQHLHLISYFSRSSPTAQVLRQPSQDPSLSQIQPAKGMYPESTVNDQSSVPAVTRSPMTGAPAYAVPQAPGYGRGGPAPAFYPHGYVPHPYMGYPMTPMHTPPGYGYAYGPMPGLPHPGYPGGMYGQPGLHINSAPPSSYDQRPMRNGEGGQAPPMTSSGSQPGMSAPTYTRPNGMPNVTGTPATPFVPPTTSYAEVNGDKAAPASSIQIDPALVSPRSAEHRAPSYSAAPRQDEDQAQNNGQPQATEHATAPAVSQAPTINSLVHEMQAHAATPNSHAASANGGVNAQKENETDRQGNGSPRGANRPPQDIPSEKLGFSADKRALSMLDRTFAARV